MYLHGGSDSLCILSIYYKIVSTSKKLNLDIVAVWIFAIPKSI